MTPNNHTRDSDCLGHIGDDDLCAVCGAYHGDPCPDCGGRGYHEEGCGGVTDHIDWLTGGGDADVARH